MSDKAIDDIKRFDEQRQLLSVAYAHAEFLRRYSPMIADRFRVDFEREFTYLVHLIYRESQKPLVDQITQFMMDQNRPIMMVKP